MSEEKKLVPKLRFPEFRGTAGWEDQSVGQYLEDCSGRVPPDTELPVYSSTREGLKRQDAYFDGQVLQNKNEYGVAPPACFVYRHMSDDGLFKFNINETGGDIAVSKEYPVFRTRGVNPVFLRAKLNDGPDFKRFALSQKAGGTRTRLYFSRLCEWRTPLPLPTEQQKIADCLSSLDELIAAQARKVDALKTHKKGLMQQLVPREGEAQPRLRFPEFREAGEWEVGLLGQFAQVNPRRETRADDVNVSFVPMSAVSEDGHLASPQIREYGSVKKGFTAFRNKDVIVAKITPCFENGKAALVTGLMDGIGFGSTEFHVVRASNACLPEFLFAQIYSDQFRRLGKSSMTGSGGQQRVPTAFVENYLVSIPSLAEQQRIADCLTSLDTLITAATQEFETLKTHKKGLMQQLFPSAEAVAA